MGQVSLFQHGSSARKTLDFSSTGSLSPFISIVIKPPKGKDQISNDRRNRLNGIIISASIEKAENVSLTPPLGKALYLYVGGESAYQINVSGFAVKNCNGNARNNGFDQIVNWYENTNVKKMGKPCKLVFNSKVFKGYLRSLSISISPKMDNAASFTLSFYGILV